MQKFFQNKRLNICLGFLFFIISIPTIIFAATSNDYYQSPKAANIPAVTQAGSATIVNRSDKTYFVPNKTAPEWSAFASNTPQYVSVAVCNDKVCSEGETTANCPQDCSTVAPYCGDGICSVSSTRVMVNYVPPKQVNKYEEICTQRQSGWMWVPIVNVIIWATGNEWNTTCNNTIKTIAVSSDWEDRGEVWEAHDTSTQTSCKDDCAAPANAGCGVCGYDPAGNACPNFCNDRGYNMTNCVYQAAHYEMPLGCDTSQAMVMNNTSGLIKKYLTASEAFATIIQSACASSGYSYQIAAGYNCSYGSDTTSLCPAGSFCPLTGGLKPGTGYTSYTTAAWLSTNHYITAQLQQPCAAGFFCPIGSTYQHTCPINTYSTGNASVCTACPAGTISLSNSSSLSMCSPAKQAGDKVCNIGENPANSPYDCPDASQIATNPWKGDNRCTGVENMANDPVDCSCGNDICDNGETILSCMKDCAGLDNVCGTKIYSYNAATNISLTTIYKESSTTNSYGKLVKNASDCQYMTGNEICGDGVCESSEGYNNSLRRIVCQLDCHCGDGYCNYSEFYSGAKPAAAGSCNADCYCGNGSCDNGLIGTTDHGEDNYNCSTDCHCGNGKCEYELNENSVSCATDCRCGDRICSFGEDSTTCLTDCAREVGYCGDGSCNYHDLGNGKYVKETIPTCASDCNLYLPQ